MNNCRTRSNDHGRSATSRRLSLSVLLALSVLSVPASSDDDLYPAGKIRGRISIDPVTGDRIINPVTTAARSPALLWDCSDSPPFYGLAQTYERLDWGDIASPAATGISEFTYAYCSTAYTPDFNNGNVTIQLTFYASENGQNTPMPPSTAIFDLLISHLPAENDPNFVCAFCGCWIMDVDLAQACQADPNLPCTLPLNVGQDLDGDGRIDFGYGMFVLASGPQLDGNPSTAGPLFAYPGPNPVGAPGATTDYNRYQAPGKWSVGNAGFIGTYNNGAQIWLQLFGCSAGDSDGDSVCDDTDNCPTVSGPPPTGCPTCPDITGDHAVDLSDLAVLLSNFGLTPATYAQGDINHDNHIDLSDLAALLSAYGATCP